MKKIYLISFVLISLSAFAQQGPIIEGTYLPVRGTAVKNIWDISPNTISIPAPGPNMVWDYSAEFLNPTDTFKIETFHPNTTPYFQYFPTATHASFLRTPLNNISDSIFSYYIIDAEGLHSLGGFNIKTASNNSVGYDTSAIISPSEFLVPSTAFYGMPDRYDTSKYVTYGKFSGNPIKILGTKYKEAIAYGYGTLKMPNGGIFNNVLLARENIKRVDSVFLAGSNSYITNLVSEFINYSFIRNNTFGSSYLMYLYADSTNTNVNNGWYSLPVDFGSISGTVYDSITGAPTTNGEAFLYRENSNFAKNDILDKSPLDALGNYQFDSIPYGQYRVSIRPDGYPTALTTYYGDTTNGNDAPSIVTTGSMSAGNNIYLRYHPDSTGLGQISGSLDLNNSIERASNPIPGIDIIVQKKPSGKAMREVKTDVDGAFTLSDLSDGNYDLFVDIPGLYMTGTYEFSILGGTLVDELCFVSGTDSIHPDCQQTVSIKQLFKNNDLMEVYPNPYTSFTTIKVDITEKCDVLLEVYNLLGEKIQTIDQSKKLPGVYSYNFTTKDLNYASGIYFIKLIAGNKTSVLKIIEQ